MLILTGKLIKDKAEKAKNGFEYRRLLIEENTSFHPVIVQVPKDYKLDIDKNGNVDLIIKATAWDDRVKKFTTNSVKFNAFISKE